jgi:DNA-binding GntR family transcriptional regulator
MKQPVASLADQIYGRVCEAIVRAQLQPGKRLVELEIAAQVGTSQGPVREALQRLERDGLVERQTRSATFVTDISADEMHSLVAIRASRALLSVTWRPKSAVNNAMNCNC